jgi:hypothetical protein
MTSLNTASIRRASDGLSMMKPSSVFSAAERGSKLNEPMNARDRSTEKVFAWRLAPEPPIGGPPELHEKRGQALHFVEG